MTSVPAVPSQGIPRRLVIANRGEIARRILRAARERGYRVAVVSTTEDADAPVRLEADAVLEVSSFLDTAAIVGAAKAWGAGFLHPGYGFLSENADFADAVEAAGIVFVGPTPENMRALGGKESAKAFASRVGVPTLGALLSYELAKGTHHDWEPVLAARGIVAPYLVKASGGGGGKGMRIVETLAELPAAIHRASQEALAGFGDATVFVERYLPEPRHVEIQVFGDGAGGGVFLGERECSLQRRHQKVIEEAPSPVVDAALRARMGESALALVRETRYRGAGTVEFLLTEAGTYFFLEMNTRLQVEHPVTENVYGVDLVQAQLSLAEGAWPAELESPAVFTVPQPRGVSLEARILAENPRADFLPTPGPLVRYLEPTTRGLGTSSDVPGATGSVRVDSGVLQGGRVNASFDSMIAKLIVHASTRGEAVATLRAALSRYVIHGCTTNIPFLLSLVEHPDFLAGRESTAWIGRNLARLNAPRVPPVLAQAFATKPFRELLADALGGASTQGANASCGLLLGAARFVRAGAGLPAVGAARVAPSFRLERETPGASAGLFLLSGEGLVDLLASMPLPEQGEHDTRGAQLVDPVAPSWTLCPELREACVRAAAQRSARRRGFVSAASEDVRIPVSITRLSREKLAMGIFGEALEFPCPRWERVRGEGVAESVPELRAPMPGKVLEIVVTKGASLKAGELAFVVESMKMQLEVRAHEDCVVEEILVEKGQMLPGPDVLALLAPKTPTRASKEGNEGR